MAVAANLISLWIKKYKWIAWLGLFAGSHGKKIDSHNEISHDQNTLNEKVTPKRVNFTKKNACMNGASISMMHRGDSCPTVFHSGMDGRH